MTKAASEKHKPADHAPRDRQNRRSLEAIAAEVRGLQRTNVFAIGDLLIEARESCDHGEWLPWLQEEFNWSADTAERYMKVARLGTKYRNLRNLHLGKTTFYALTKEEDEKELPAIIEALAKVATSQQLRPAEAEEVIKRARMRAGGGASDHNGSATGDVAGVDVLGVDDGLIGDANNGVGVNGKSRKSRPRSRSAKPDPTLDQSEHIIRTGIVQVKVMIEKMLGAKPGDVEHELRVFKSVRYCLNEMEEARPRTFPARFQGESGGNLPKET